MQNRDSRPEEAQTKALPALGGFARKAAAVSQFMDFKPSDLVYEATKDRWVLLDYTGLAPLGLRRNGERDHPFGDAFEEALLRRAHPLTGETLGRRPSSEWEREVLGRLDAVIRRERRLTLFTHPIRTCFRSVLSAGKPYVLRAPPEIEAYMRSIGLR